jgi:hypothetical protein
MQLERKKSWGGHSIYAEEALTYNARNAAALEMLALSLSFNECFLNRQRRPWSKAGGSRSQQCISGS